jgi:hypothetical protein
MLDLNIPHEVLQKYLPSQNLTIPNLISFSLPCIATKLIKDIYISSEPATACSNTIRKLLSDPVPCSALVEDLITTLQSVSPPIAQSVAITDFADSSVSGGHGVEYFPLWIITCWKELVRVAEHRKCWAQAYDVLRQLRTSTSDMPELVDTVHKTLSHLPWHGSVL